MNAIIIQVVKLILAGKIYLYVHVIMLISVGTVFILKYRLPSSKDV